MRLSFCYGDYHARGRSTMRGKSLMDKARQVTGSTSVMQAKDDIAKAVDLIQKGKRGDRDYKARRINEVIEKFLKTNVVAAPAQYHDTKNATGLCTFVVNFMGVRKIDLGDRNLHYIAAKYAVHGEDDSAIYCFKHVKDFDWDFYFRLLKGASVLQMHDERNSFLIQKSVKLVKECGSSAIDIAELYSVASKYIGATALEFDEFLRFVEGTGATDEVSSETLCQQFMIGTGNEYRRSSKLLDGVKPTPKYLLERCFGSNLLATAHNPLLLTALEHCNSAAEVEEVKEVLDGFAAKGHNFYMDRDLLSKLIEASLKHEVPGCDLSHYFELAAGDSKTALAIMLGILRYGNDRDCYYGLVKTMELGVLEGNKANEYISAMLNHVCEDRMTIKRRKKVVMSLLHLTKFEVVENALGPRVTDVLLLSDSPLNVAKSITTKWDLSEEKGKKVLSCLLESLHRDESYRLDYNFFSFVMSNLSIAEGKVKDLGTVTAKLLQKSLERGDFAMQEHERKSLYEEYRLLDVGGECSSSRAQKVKSMQSSSYNTRRNATLCKFYFFTNDRNRFERDWHMFTKTLWLKWVAIQMCDANFLETVLSANSIRIDEAQRLVGTLSTEGIAERAQKFISLLSHTEQRKCERLWVSKSIVGSISDLFQQREPDWIAKVKQATHLIQRTNARMTLHGTNPIALMCRELGNCPAVDFVSRAEIISNVAMYAEQNLSDFAPLHLTTWFSNIMYGFQQIVEMEYPPLDLSKEGNEWVPRLQAGIEALRRLSVQNSIHIGDLGIRTFGRLYNLNNAIVEKRERVEFPIETYSDIRHYTSQMNAGGKTEFSPSELYDLLRCAIQIGPESGQHAIDQCIEHVKKWAQEHGNEYASENLTLFLSAAQRLDYGEGVVRLMNGFEDDIESLLSTDTALLRKVSYMFKNPEMGKLNADEVRLRQQNQTRSFAFGDMYKVETV
eukprot:Nk52_evm4s287 gene=Nk52_evmTU4s287